MAGVSDVIESIGTAVSLILGALAVFLPALRKFRDPGDDRDDSSDRPRSRRRHRRRRD